MYALLGTRRRNVFIYTRLSSLDVHYELHISATHLSSSVKPSTELSCMFVSLVALARKTPPLIACQNVDFKFVVME